MTALGMQEILAGRTRLADNLTQKPEPGIAGPAIMTQDERVFPRYGELIRRSLAGDTRAMQEIYDQFKRPLFGLALRHASDQATAEDLLQDIFLKVFIHLRDVTDEKTFPAWVYRVGLNTCYSHLRSLKSRGGPTVPISEVEGSLEDAVSNHHEKGMNKPLEEAIQSLPGKLRSVVLLHDVEGFKHEEIAGMMGWSVGTSKSQLFKARMRLRKVLQAKGNL